MSFPKVTALGFIRNANAPLAMCTNIFATSVTAHTQFLSAIFVPLPKPPVISPNLPNLSPPSLPTPVKVERLGFLLNGYAHSTIDFLLSGFSQGFPIHFYGERTSCSAKNLLLALENSGAVDAKLQKEFAAVRLAGPFQSPPLSPFWVSPLRVIPKKVPGEFRLIHHLSFPKGSSVNDGIPYEHSSVNYAAIDQAIQLIKTAGPGCFLAKTDIKNAFRIIPIHHRDYGLLGMQWRGLYYNDQCMPTGCSSLWVSVCDQYMKL